MKKTKNINIYMNRKMEYTVVFLQALSCKIYGQKQCNWCKQDLPIKYKERTYNQVLPINFLGEIIDYVLPINKI